MGATANSIRRTISGTALAGLLLLFSTAGNAQTDDVASAPKLVRSAAGHASDRAELPIRDRSGLVESEVTTVERMRSADKGDSTTAAAVFEEAWVYDANVDLFDDFDGDGYFTYLRVSFDADSIYADHYLYARLFLTLDGVNWDEYHVTDDFLVQGTTAFDVYEVETELVAGFQTGLYDVLIELYDADFGHFLGEFGPAQSSAFSLLPLEDIDNDVTQTTVVISSESGGGVSGVFSLAILGLLSVLAGRRRRIRSS